MPPCGWRRKNWKGPFWFQGGAQKFFWRTGLRRMPLPPGAGGSMRVRIVPALEIGLAAAWLLLLLDRALPGFVGLFRRLPVGPLARIVARFFLAHGSAP